jgi:hypothetical protein
MSLVYPATDPCTSDPTTHVLIIGVGEYLHLPKGPRFASAPAKHTLGLKQLSSPRISAEKLANWMIRALTHTHTNPKAPLGTVELLLSPSKYTDLQGNVTHVDVATFDATKAAFARWLERCDRNPDNVALFYFCGHGLEWDKMYLFPADYGASRGTPWENLIDFNTSRFGFLGDCAATTLCCFIDACREVTPEFVRQLKISSRPLWDMPSLPAGDRDAPIFKAARWGEKAHGPQNGVSYFTDALIQCLERFGAGYPPNGTTWKVSTNSLGLALKQLMRRTLIPNVGYGACDVGGESNTPAPTILHDLPGVAHALGEITYDPDAALADADLSYCATGTGGLPKVRSPRAANAWQIEVPAGTYDISVTFDNGRYRADQRPAQVISPPFTTCTLGGSGQS